MTSYETITVAIEDGVATVTINRPDKLNALNAQVLAELTGAFVALAEAAPPVRAAILTGAGDKAFVAGAASPRWRGSRPPRPRPSATQATAWDW